MMPEVGRLVATTRAIDDPGDLLAVARGCPGTPVFYWEHPARGEALLALGVVRELRASGADRFTRLSAAALRVLATVEADSAAHATLRVVGGFAFSERPEAGAVGAEFPPARLVLPRLLWLRSAGRTTLTAISDEGDAAVGAALRARVPVAASEPGSLRLSASPLDGDECGRWRERVARAHALIADGTLEKVVLARRRRLSAADPIDPTTLLARARAARPTCFNVWVRGRRGASLVASTPELLVRRQGHAVTASALAGSAPRAPDAAADARAAAALLACPKNAREHAIVVAAVRAALAEVADDVTTSPTPGLLSLPEVHHLATMVAGRLRAPASVLDIGAVLHPTPAVCGAPRAPARALIECEEPERGWYTGALGWMDATGDGELAVALRSALVVDRHVTLWAGAGIVEGSDADAELAETEAKMCALVAPFLGPARTAAAAPPSDGGAASEPTPDASVSVVGA